MRKHFSIVKAWVVVFLALLLTSQYANAANAGTQKTGNEQLAKVAQQAPDFTLRALDGEQVSLENLQEDGNVLLLFWSMDCVYCLAHMSDYQRLHEIYNDKGLSVAAINIGGENYEDIAEYVEENELEFIFLSNRHHNFKVAEQYSVIATPTLVLVSSDGEVLYRGHAIPDMSQWFTQEQKLSKQDLP